MAFQTFEEEGGKEGARGVVRLAISLLKLYAGVRDLRFERRVARQTGETRDLQTRVPRKYGLDRDSERAARP